MKTKFELGEEVYVKARVVNVGLVSGNRGEEVTYTVETTSSPRIKVFELKESHIERRVQQ